MRVGKAHIHHENGEIQEVGLVLEGSKHFVWHEFAIGHATEGVVPGTIAYQTVIEARTALQAAFPNCQITFG